MKEILKSKVMVIFALTFIGVIYVNSTITVSLEDKSIDTNENIVAVNI